MGREGNEDGEDPTANVVGDLLLQYGPMLQELLIPKGARSRSTTKDKSPANVTSLVQTFSPFGPQLSPLKNESTPGLRSPRRSGRKSF